MAMKNLTLAVLGIGLLGLGAAHAQSFVRFEGIDGEVKVEGYENWCELTSVVQQIKPSETKSGVVMRRELEFDDLVIVKPVDKASPKIVDRALRASVTPRVEIEWVRTTGQALEPFYRYELRNALIKEYTSKGLGESEDPAERVMEQISLDFEEITVTYWEYDEDGNPLGAVEYSWAR
jgi:type VI secretion system Hcp family effector